MLKKYINDSIYLVNDGTSVYPVYGCDVEDEITINDAEVVAGPFSDTPQNQHAIEKKCEKLNDELNGVNSIYEAKKHRTIYLTRDQIKRLNEMDVSLSSDGTVAGAQDVVNKNQAQFAQAKSMDGKKPNATITTPKTDNAKPTAHIQSSPGESPAQAISKNSETVQKVFDNNGSISVEVNENRNSYTKERIMESIRKRKMNEAINYASTHATGTINILNKKFINELIDKYDIDPEEIGHYIIYDESVPEEITFTINGSQETWKGDYDTPDYIQNQSDGVEFDDETVNWLQEIPAELADAIVASINDYARQNANRFDWSEPESDFGNENEFMSEAYISRKLKESIRHILGSQKKRIQEGMTTDNPAYEKWDYLIENYGAEKILEQIFLWTSSSKLEEYIQWFEQEGYFENEDYD